MALQPKKRDPEVAKLAYEAAVKRLDRQEAKLDEIRQRTTLLLGAATVATSFLAAAALTDRKNDFSLFTWLGFGAAVVASIALVIILLPTRAPRQDAETGGGEEGWIFSPRTDEFIDSYYRGEYRSADGQPGQPHSLEATHADLAVKMAGWHRTNDAGLQTLYNWFFGAALAVGIDLVVWLIDLVFFYEQV